MPRTSAYNERIASGEPASRFWSPASHLAWTRRLQRLCPVLPELLMLTATPSCLSSSMFRPSNSPTLNPYGNVILSVWCVPEDGVCHTRAIRSSAAYLTINKGSDPSQRIFARMAPAHLGCANLGRQDVRISPCSRIRSEEYWRLTCVCAGFAPGAWLRSFCAAVGQAPEPVAVRVHP